MRWGCLIVNEGKVLSSGPEVGGEGLELHTYTWPHMDSIDLDPQPILGIRSDKY